MYFCSPGSENEHFFENQSSLFWSCSPLATGSALLTASSMPITWSGVNQSGGRIWGKTARSRVLGHGITSSKKQNVTKKMEFGNVWKEIKNVVKKKFAIEVKLKKCFENQWHSTLTWSFTPLLRNIFKIFHTVWKYIESTFQCWFGFDSPFFLAGERLKWKMSIKLKTRHIADTSFLNHLL